MKTLNRQMNAGLVVAFATIATIAQPQAASAQILEAVGGALNAIIGSKKPQPQVIQQRVPVPVPTGPQFDVGTNNANGNSLNLCISNCLPPGSIPAPVYAPQPVPQPVPQVVQQPQPVPVQQQTNTVVQQSNQSATVQNVPNRPTVSIPPISLPINLPR